MPIKNWTKPKNNFFFLAAVFFLFIFLKTFFGGETEIYLLIKMQ